MEYTKLGSKNISRICLGCMTFAIQREILIVGY